MRARWASFLVWAAVAASAVYWVLRLFTAAPAVPPHAVAVGAGGAPRGDVARVLGALPDAAPSAPVAAAPAPSRFKLVGVVAPRHERDARVGVALIAVDDKPPKAYRVGAVIDGETVLRSVLRRSVELGPREGPAAVLELPALPPPATGTLPPPGSAPPSAAPPLVRPGRPGARPVLPPIQPLPQEAPTEMEDDGSSEPPPPTSHPPTMVPSGLPTQ